MQEITPIWTSGDGVMKVGALMSGSGTNLVKIIEHEQKTNHHYRVALIVSDNPESNAAEIAKRYGRPLLIHDLRAVCRELDVDEKNLAARRDHDKLIRTEFQTSGIDFAVLAGYDWRVTRELEGHYDMLNVHPADLRVINPATSRRAYTGLGWVPVAKAILAEEKTIRSTVHFVTQEIDGGPIAMVSEPLEVTVDGADYEAIKRVSIERIREKQKLGVVLTEGESLLVRLATEHQNRLKEAGDWKIFPETLKLIVFGRFGFGNDNMLYFDDKPVPKGVEYKDGL